MSKTTNTLLEGRGSENDTSNRKKWRSSEKADTRRVEDCFGDKERKKMGGENIEQR